jgi:thiol-disulfide isomerase/thioredoxin
MRFTVPALLVAALVTAAPALAQDKAADKPAPKAPAKSSATLVAGDAAPALSIDKWIKGAPVPKFESGKVYVVEFWATWCGPCIASMPHLSALQKEFKDSVTIIGVTSQDPRNTLEGATKMATDKGDTMGYTVAWDSDRATNNSYMKAANQNGIPCSFVIDKTGKIAYIGHPMFLDMVLEPVVAGKWDTKTGNAAVKDAEDKLYGKNGVFAQAQSDPEGALKTLNEIDAKYPKIVEAAGLERMKYHLLLQTGNAPEAHKLGLKLVDKAVKDKDAMALNEIAWGIVDPEGNVKNKDLDLALKAAEEGVKASDNKDGMIMDTLARVYWVKGDKAKAIETQTKAVALAPEGAKAQLQKSLDEYNSSK